jgi:hypothetical protein
VAEEASVEAAVEVEEASAEAVAVEVEAAAAGAGGSHEEIPIIKAPIFKGDENDLTRNT